MEREEGLIRWSVQRGGGGQTAQDVERAESDSRRSEKEEAEEEEMEEEGRNGVKEERNFSVRGENGVIIIRSSVGRIGSPGVVLRG